MKYAKSENSDGLSDVGDDWNPFPMSKLFLSPSAGWKNLFSLLWKGECTIDAYAEWNHVKSPPILDIQTLFTIIQSLVKKMNKGLIFFIEAVIGPVPSWTSSSVTEIVGGKTKSEVSISWLGRGCPPISGISEAFSSPRSCPVMLFLVQWDNLLLYVFFLIYSLV